MTGGRAGSDLGEDKMLADLALLKAREAHLAR